MNRENFYSITPIKGSQSLLFSVTPPINCSKISLDTKALLCALQGSMDQDNLEYTPKVIQNTSPYKPKNSYLQDGGINIDNTQIAPIDIVKSEQDPSISISLKNVRQFKTELKMDTWTGLPEKIVAGGPL